MPCLAATPRPHPPRAGGDDDGDGDGDDLPHTPHPTYLPPPSLAPFGGAPYALVAGCWFVRLVTCLTHAPALCLVAPLA